MCFRKMKIELNNNGMSLVELLVVIAIMSIILASTSIGVSLAFSKDAEECAIALNDALYNSRINAMSKAGAYKVTFSMNSDGEILATENDGTVDISPSTVIGKKGKIAVINVSLSGSPSSYVIDATNSVSIRFDKSKGCVRAINENEFDSTDSTKLQDGVITFTIRQKSGKEVPVTLITSTGKHTVGTF